MRGRCLATVPSCLAVLPLIDRSMQWWLGGAPGRAASSAEALVRVAPLRVPVAPLDYRMASRAHAHQFLVRRASRRSWSSVDGRGRASAAGMRAVRSTHVRRLNLIQNQSGK